MDKRLKFVCNVPFGKVYPAREMTQILNEIHIFKFYSNFFSQQSKKSTAHLWSKMPVCFSQIDETPVIAWENRFFTDASATD